MIWVDQTAVNLCPSHHLIFFSKLYDAGKLDQVEASFDLCFHNSTIAPGIRYNEIEIHQKNDFGYWSGPFMKFADAYPFYTDWGLSLTYWKEDMNFDEQR